MPATVGARIRELRQRRGLSQLQLAGSLPINPSYISLIETDRRRPRQRTLALIADRLGCTTQYLLTGTGGPDAVDLDLELRFAELALRSGDREAAGERYRAVLEQARALRHEDAEHDARWGLSRVQVATGDLESAIETMEALAAEPQLKGTVSRTKLAANLAHAYTECGEPTRAIEVAERALADPDGAESPDDERIRLASTLVLAHYNRGDLVRAHLLVRRVIEDAEQSRSPLARAAAYWNAGLVAEARGDLRSARTFTERALALYGELDNERATAILRLNCAGIMLRSAEPDLAAAASLLDRAYAELRRVGTETDVALVETELARLHLLAGDAGAAMAGALAALDRLGAGQRLESANATVVLARARFAAGDLHAATASYAEAARRLTSVEASRQVAALWLELAEGLTVLDRVGEALDAYRRAADAAGLTGQPLPLTSETAAGPRRQ